MGSVTRCTECGTPYFAGKGEHCPACLAVYMKFITEVAKIKGKRAKIDFEEFIAEARKKNKGGHNEL